MNIVTIMKNLRQVRKFEKLLEHFYQMKNACYTKNTLEISSGDYEELLHEECIKQFGAEYEELRKKIAKTIPIMKEIATLLKFNPTYTLILRGTSTPVCIFDSILSPGYEPMPRREILDYLNKMIGSLENNKRKAIYTLINPLAWLSFILKIPFWIIKQTGFNVDKVEDHLIGKLIKLVETLLLTYILLRHFGFTKEQLIRLFHP